jgi:hypothetical protein
MAYTKYSLTPADNNAAPPNGAPEGMLPSAVNDTMRDMMAQIRDVGDGIRGGTYTMTAPVITGGSITGAALSGNTFTNPVVSGGSINNTPIGATTASTGAFSTLSVTGATTFSGATVANTFSSSGATITGGSINGTTVGGTTAAAGKFTTLEATGVSTVQAGTAADPAITTTGDTNTGIFFPAADTIAFSEGGTEAMRVDSSGNLLVGTTSNSNAVRFKVDANGVQSAGEFYQPSTVSYTSVIFSNPNGTVGSITTNGSATSYATSSDYRLKENIAPMTGALNVVQALKPVTYNWKINGSDGQGFIAHELQEVVPDCVTGEKDAVNEDGSIKAQGIDTSFLVATLTAAIQELKATVDAQAARIAALENHSVEN